MKKRRVGLIVFLVVLVIIIAGGIFGWIMLKKEHKEAMSVNVENIEFKNLEDGTYEGYYVGGMYGWRENKVEVVIKDAEVVEIKLLTVEASMQVEVINELYDRVIDKQSLNVDVVSGSTLTSKAYLKGIEDALN